MTVVVFELKENLAYTETRLFREEVILILKIRTHKFSDNWCRNDLDILKQFTI
jgi:hypothetical protein